MVTPIQHRVFLFIQDYISQKGFSPSLVEIAKGIGISENSISLVSRCVHALVESGKLTFHKKGYRNIHVASSNDFSLPIINGLVSEKKMDLSRIFRAKEHFLFEITSDELTKEGIFNGDLVICQQNRDAKEGDIVLALIDEQETLKRISFKIPDRITLIPMDVYSKPKAHLPNRVTIKGIVSGILRLLSSPPAVPSPENHFQNF